MAFEDNFPGRLRSLRQDRNLTQKKLAEEIGSVMQTVNTWEMGASTPPLKVLWQLADFFEVSLDHLVGRDDNPQRRG
ncbi:transcriptional regulator [Clostridia bacterium]|nr:transcriptional regulator [Clostridia bacterium]